jgi:hypothetical protein
MKKMILVFSIIIGCCFAQTGMMAEKGYGAFGIWVEATGPVDSDYGQERAIVSLDYMTKFGLEIGIKVGTLTYNTFAYNGFDYDDYSVEYTVTGYNLEYHFKNNNMYRGGTNFYIGYDFEELSFEDEATGELSDPLSEMTTYSLGLYSNKRTFFELSQETYTELVSGYEQEFENEYVEFGGIVRFGRKAGLLISYKLDTDAVEAMFDEEDFDYFKQGDLTLGIGAAFGSW